MSAREAEHKRGPKVGDAASLWNFTPSPGWTKEEAQILKLCLMKYGVGRWVQILDTGLLPGKLIQQLNGQTQRLIGQQSLAAYTGLQVDIDRIRADNAARTDVERKSGLIIWSGPNPNKKMRDEWRKEAQSRFGLAKEELKDVDELLEEVTKKVHQLKPQRQSRSPGIPLVSLLESETHDLPREQKLALLKQLRKGLQLLHAQLLQAEAAPAQQEVPASQDLQLPETCANAAANEDDDDDDNEVLPVRMLVSRRSAGRSSGNNAQTASPLQPSSRSIAAKKPPRGAAKRKSTSGVDSAGKSKRHTAPALQGRHARSGSLPVETESSQPCFRILQSMARSKVYKSKPKPVEEELPSDDEIDAFDKQKDFISLDAAKESESDDAEDEGLYDLSDDADDSSDDEFDSDDSDAEGGTLGRLKRTEKAMRNKLSVQQAEEGDEEDGEDDLSAKDKQWGKSKRGYYGADTEEYELTDDEEALKDEEEEAQRLQRQAAEQLQPEDFEQEEDGLEASSSSDKEDETMGAKARQANGVASSAANAPTVERLERDEGALTDEQRMSAVMADAPELAALLSELQGSLAEVRSHVGPVLKEVRGGNLATAEGVSYLEAKHLLLLHYCINIVFYLLLKAEGRPVRDHPVIPRLLELRAYLEKIRPIDKKLQYQMDKLLMAAQLQISGKDQEVAADSTAAVSDPLRFGPKPDQLIPKLAQDTQATEGGVYRPPKLNPVSMDNDPDKDYGKKERRRQEHAARKAGRSDFVQALASELEGAPEELRASSAVAGNETLEALRHRQRLEARAAEEEDLMVRVPLSKEQKKQLKADRRVNLSGAAMMNDFADDVADLVGMDNGGAAGLDDRFLGNQLSQKFGADLLTQQKGKLRSGDDDLSAKLPLSQRRAKYDGVKAKQSAKTNAFGSDDDGEQPKKRVREEDDFYKESKALAEGKKKSKKGKYTAPDTLPPRPDPTVEGARAITTDIEKNRGLTPHRSKATKNPRKHNRNKFEKATMRRKGQVQEAKTGSAGGYGGEQTGIKSGVTRGVRF